MGLLDGTYNPISLWNNIPQQYNMDELLQKKKTQREPFVSGYVGIPGKPEYPGVEIPKTRAIETPFISSDNVNMVQGQGMFPWMYNNYVSKIQPNLQTGEYPSPIKINPKQFYDEQYKQWGGLEGLQKLRIQNGIDPNISYNDFKAPYYDEMRKDMPQYFKTNVEDIFPSYNPFERMKTEVGMQYEKRLADVSKNGVVAGGYYNVDKNMIGLNPTLGFMPKKDSVPAVGPEAFDSIRHEIGHTYQNNDNLFDKKNTTMRNAYKAFNYEKNPNEVAARMSAVMGRFVDQAKTPVYNEETANKFLNYMRANQREDYDILSKKLQMKDDDIKTLSKKIVSNDVPQNSRFA
jgi:hypothetical protein